MKKNWRKFLSALLAVAMVVTTYHVSPRAAGYEAEVTDAVEADVTDTSNVSDEELKDVRLPKLGEQEEEPEELVKPNLSEIVRVSIILKAPSTVDAGYSIKNIASNSAARSYRETLKANQARVTSQIESVIGQTLDVKWNLTLAANIISANVKRGDIIKIAALSDVKKVVLENYYTAPVVEPNTSTSTKMVGADSVAWANGYYGAGSKVMIIDTGTNQDHISFDPEALEYALTKDGKSLSDYDLLTKEDVAAVVDQLNANNTTGKHNIDAASAYKNIKIPYAFNYVDGNYTTDHYSDTQEEHGSHVSGIAAANRYVKQNGEFVSALDSVMAVGVAPDAQILTAKVFGQGGGAYDSDYFAAIEDGIILGADSANLSLGSAAPGFTFSADYKEILDGLTEKGMTVVMSAGNSYGFNENDPKSGVPYTFYEDVNKATDGSPGSFVNSFAVASANNTGVTGAPLIFNGDQIVFYTETEGYGNPNIKTIAGNYEYVAIDGIGSAEEYAAVNEDVSLEGKVVLVSRGTSSFFEKGNNAIDYNPVAVVIINNQPGTISMNLSGFTGGFPMVSIPLADGQALKAASETGTAGNYTYYTGTVEVSDKLQSAVVSEDPIISDFSSWGGNGSMLIKPEITAPGGNIWSVNGMKTDAFELMSGTSMAAPHVTGMVALFGEYYEDVLKETVDAAFPDEAFSERQLAQSLLMSTAIPMREPDSGYEYYPIQRQGAGLGNIGNAINAKSFLMMDKDATISAADGKVKAELGQSTEGKYSYSFTIYNPSKYDLIYDLSTDLFTQDVFADYAYDVEGEVDVFAFMDAWTISQDSSGVSYEFEQLPLHDVDKDGDTDTDDVQAILDGVTGVVDLTDASKYDRAAGDMDADDEITSLDAKLLLDWLYSMNGAEEDEDTVLVPAGGKKTVKVTVNVSNWDDSYYPSGMWVEGFTYVTCQSISEDGEILEVEHSIPLLGFYGSFAESSMFDANSYVGYLYGNNKVAYSGAVDTNYMNIKYQDGTNAKFSGNPYALEEEFPEERLALNTEAAVTNFNTVLIRGAGTAAVVAVRLDEDGNPTEVLSVNNMEADRYPLYYYVNQATWMNTNPINTKTNLLLSELDLEEDDRVRIGYYAIPEYYAMQLNGSTSGTLTEDELKTAILSTDSKTVLGSGVYVGYDFTIDNTAPSVTVEVDQEAGTVTVTAQDNQYIAFVALADLGGTTVYDGQVPEQTEAGEEVTVTFDVAEIDENALAVIVGDYACNETAKLAKLNDEPIIMKVPVYMLTDELVAGNDYIIANTNQAGTAYALLSNGQNYYTSSIATTVTVDEKGTYIAAADADDTFVWTASEGVTLQNKADGGWLGFRQPDDPYVSWANAGYADELSYENGKLLMAGTTYGMQFSNPYFMFSAAPNEVYLYSYQVLDVEVDPTEAWEITVTPENTTLILDVIPTVQLKTSIQPVVLDDQTVTWESSDPSVATVDENGLVTAVALGTTVITATTNAEPHLSASATINVTAGQPMDAEIFAQVAYGNNDIRFAKINLNDMSVTTEGEAFSAFYGGGRSGNYVYGNDVDNDFHRFDITNNYAYDDEYHFVISAAWALIDGASYPAHTLTFESGEVSMDAILAGFTNSSKWAMFKEDGSLTYFDLSSLGTYVAAAFAGVEEDYEDEEGNVYELALSYLFLANDGTLYLWNQMGTETGGSTAEYFELGHINVLSFGDDLTAYSMAYDDDNFGVFIADNTSKGIYFVDLMTLIQTGEFDAVFVGRLEGATNLSTMYNDTFDSVGELSSSELNRLVGGKDALGTMSSVTVESVLPIAKDEAPAPEPEVEPSEEATEEPAPVEEPTEEVTEAPTEEPAPVEEPTEEATEASTEEPAPVEDPTEEVTEAPTEETEPAEEPTEEETEAPAEETEAAEEPTEEATEEVTEAPTEETEPVEEPTEEETEAPTEVVIEVTEPAVFGGLNAAPVRATEQPVIARQRAASEPMATSTSSAPKVVVTVTEDEDVNNGKLTVTYDPESLKYVGVTTPAEAGADLEDLFSSVNVDEKAGTVQFAYATLEAVAAGETLLEVEFEPIACEESEVTIATEERNKELELSEEETTEVEGTGHDWALESVEWEGSAAEGYVTATYTFVCQNNEEHVKVVVDEKLVESTEEDGDTTTITYTAEVVGPDGETYTEEKTVTITTEYVDGTVTLVKVDEDDEALEGASFGLYEDEACTKEITTLTAGTVEISTADDYLADYLPEAGESVTLYLKEVKAPDGFKADEDVYELVIEAAVETEEEEDTVTNTITYTITLDGDEELRVTNTAIKEEPGDTPETGDPSNLPMFMTMGSSAAAMLAVVMHVRRKKEDAEEE